MDVVQTGKQIIWVVRHRNFQNSTRMSICYSLYFAYVYFACEALFILIWNTSTHSGLLPNAFSYWIFIFYIFLWKYIITSALGILLHICEKRQLYVFSVCRDMLNDGCMSCQQLTDSANSLRCGWLGRIKIWQRSNAMLCFAEKIVGNAAAAHKIS